MSNQNYVRIKHVRSLFPIIPQSVPHILDGKEKDPKCFRLSISNYLFEKHENHRQYLCKIKQIFESIGPHKFKFF